MVDQLHSIERLEEVLEAPRVLVYKHSTRCGLCTRTIREVEAFAEKFPDARIELVDVLVDRSVSDAIETRLGVHHESPQAILVEGGKAIHHASHRGVSAARLAIWWEGDDSDS